MRGRASFKKKVCNALAQKSILRLLWALEGAGSHPRLALCSQAPPQAFRVSQILPPTLKPSGCARFSTESSDQATLVVVFPPLQESGLRRLLPCNERTGHQG